MSARPTPRRAPAICGLLACSAALLFNTSAAAQDTQRADLSLFITPEISTMRLFGESHDLSSWSIGAHLRQGLSIGPFTASLRIGGDAFLTYQEGPPLQRGLRTFMVNFATGVRLPLGPVRLGGLAEYAIVNLSGNPLDQTIGPSSRYHLAGGSAVLSFSTLAPLLVEVRVTGWHWFQTETPTNALQITFSIGLETLIRR